MWLENAKMIKGCNPLSMRKKFFFIHYDKNFCDANISLLLQRTLPTSVGSFLTRPSNTSCTSQAYHVPSSWNTDDAFLHLHLVGHQDRDPRFLLQEAFLGSLTLSEAPLLYFLGHHASSIIALVILHF